MAAMGGPCRTTRHSERPECHPSSPLCLVLGARWIASPCDRPLAKTAPLNGKTLLNRRSVGQTECLRCAVRYIHEDLERQGRAWAR